MDNYTFLDKLTDGFYFGQGGIGDALLLISSIYKAEETNTTILFWAHDIPTVKSIFDYFPVIKKALVLRAPMEKKDYDALVSHANFKGKAHFPDNMEFVKEWATNATTYLSLILRPMASFVVPNRSGIGLSAHGSAQEPWKRRRATEQEFRNMQLSLLESYPIEQIKVYGSSKDQEEYPTIGHERIVDERSLPISNQLDSIRHLRKLYGVDTWHKTWSGLLGTPTTVIQSEYQVPIEVVFPSVGFDPSDNIFLQKAFWGFTFGTFTRLDF